MHIHIKTDVISIRVYSEGCSYHNKDKYNGIVTGYALSDDELYLVGAHGEIGLKVIKEIRKSLIELGYKTLTLERHGKIKHIEL